MRLEVAHFEISDIKLVIVFVDPALVENTTALDQQRICGALETCAARQNLRGAVVPVWQDRYGRTQFIASAEQHPFFQVTAFSQLKAQVNSAVDCDLTNL